MGDSVWALDTHGAVHFRKNVTRVCPQGDEWITVECEKKIEWLDVSPHGEVWLCDEDGAVLMREGVTVQNPLGVAWVMLKDQSRRIIKLSAGSLLVWAVSDSGDIFTRKHSHGEVGDLSDPWTLIPGLLLSVSVSPNNLHVWGVNENYQILYREGVSETNLWGSNWSKIDVSLKCVSPFFPEFDPLYAALVSDSFRVITDRI